MTSAVIKIRGRLETAKAVKEMGMCNKRMIHLATLLLLIFSLSGHADVHMPEGEYYQDIDDLTVKVLGGEITVRRTWYKGEWFHNRAWEPLELKGPADDQNAGEKLYVDGVVRNEDAYKPTFSTESNCFGSCGNPGPGEACASPPISEVLACLDRHAARLNAVGVFYQHNAVNAAFIDDSAKRITRTESGYRWTNKYADWIDYDPQGVIQSYGNKAGITATFTYDAQGRRASVRDRLGNPIFSYEYDTENRLRFVRADGNRQVEYRYTDDLLSEVVDVRGNIWRYSYSQTGPESSPRLVTVTDPKNRITTIGYTESGRVSGEQLADSEGNRRETSYVYDYDANRKQFLVQIRGPMGAVTERYYDRDAVLVRKTVNGQDVFSRERDYVNGGIVHILHDRRRLKTVKVFDDWKNLIKTTYPDGTVTSATYEPRTTRLNERIDELGRITRYEYYDNGLLHRLTEAAGTPQERVTEYQYNAHNQRSQQRRLGDADTQEAITSYSYNLRGLLETVTGPEGGVTRYGYNERGDITSRIDPNNHSWSYTYDAAGNLESVTDPLQHTTTYRYDLNDQLASETDPLNQTTGYHFDLNGNLSSLTDPLSNSQRLAYDLEDRLISYQDAASNLIQLGYGERAGEGGGSTGGVSYPGQLNRIAFPTYLQTYDYDRRNRRTRTIDHLESGAAIQTTEVDVDIHNINWGHP